MPAGKRPQSNVMLYSLIAFIGLFVATTTTTIVYYVKYEEQVEIAQTKAQQTRELATPQQLDRIGELLGEKSPQETWLGVMLNHVNTTLDLIFPGVPEDTSVEVNVNNASLQVQEALGQLSGEYLPASELDPNTTGLLNVISKLRGSLQNITQARDSLEEQLSGLQKQFDRAMDVTYEKEQQLMTEKENLDQKVEKARQDYNDLQKLLRQSTEQQVQNLMVQMDDKDQQLQQRKEELLKTQAQLDMTKEKLDQTVGQLREVKPIPDTEAAAYKSDAEVILVDNESDIVHLDIGRKDKVYRGLTFSIYARNKPIGKNGEGKAEVEVFNIKEDFCTARIVQSTNNNPIMPGDIAANLVWDSEKSNLFVVAGDFDLDQNDNLQEDAVAKITNLLNEWGAKVENEVSVATDFVILGRPPEVRDKPTFEEMEIYPNAMERYQKSLWKLERYNEISQQARNLMVPIFNLDRFLNFTGYQTQARQAGSF